MTIVFKNSYTKTMTFIVQYSALLSCVHAVEKFNLRRGLQLFIFIGQITSLIG